MKFLPTSTSQISRQMSKPLRHELKFRIDPLQYGKLLGLCHRLLTPDPHATAGIYKVKSLYYDTPGHRDYDGTIRNQFARYKMRLRTYGAGGDYKLEQKFKKGSLSGKRVVFLNEEQAHAVACGDYLGLSSMPEDGPLLYSILQSELYRPVLVVQYHRDAFLMDVDNFRLTLDSQISYGLPAAFFDPSYPLVRSGSPIVLEIKYDDYLPAWLMAELKKCGVQLSTNSKYCQGMRSIYGLTSV